VSDLNTRAIASLRAELSCQREIAKTLESALERVRGELEQQRTCIADLKAELAESKAAANRVTESMGSEIMRLTAELEQQRTRAEAAEQELREQHAAYIAPMSDKLAAIRAHLAGVDVAKLGKMAKKAHEGPWGFWPNYGITPNKEKYGSGCTLSLDGDGKKPGPDTAFVIAIRNAADALLAAAREALEP